MKKNIRILVVDDHQVVREGLRHLLAQEEDMETVGQGANGEEALSQMEVLSPDIVLMDIKMPGVNGIELTRRIIQKYPFCKVIMLTLYDEYPAQAMEAGAKGYLLKDIKREELTQAIRRIYSGEVVISKSITSKAQFEDVKRHVRQMEEVSGTMAEEVQLILAPPVETNQLMRLSGRVEEMLQSRAVQVVGSWQEGTVITIILDKAIALADIINKLENVPEVEAITENPVSEEVSPKLLKKAADIPRPKNRVRKTIFVTFEKDHARIANKQY